MKKKSVLIMYREKDDYSLPKVIIVKGIDDEAIEQTKSSIAKNPDDYEWKVIPFEQITKVDSANLTRSMLDEIEDENERVEKLSEIYEEMLVKGNIDLKTLQEVFAPYCEPEKDNDQLFCLPNFHKINPGERLSRFAAIFFRYLPRKKSPFAAGSEQRYEIWGEVTSNGNEPKGRIVFRLLEHGTYQKDIYFAPFIKEFSRTIPDLKNRIETLIFQNL